LRAKRMVYTLWCR